MATPVISGTNQSLGSKTDSFSVGYSVSDSDTSKVLTIKESINGVVINTISNATRDKMYYIAVTKQQLFNKPAGTTNTISIDASDGSTSVNRTYTFTVPELANISSDTPINLGTLSTDFEIPYLVNYNGVNPVTVKEYVDDTLHATKLSAVNNTTYKCTMTYTNLSLVSFYEVHYIKIALYVGSTLMQTLTFSFDRIKTTDVSGSVVLNLQQQIDDIKNNIAKLVDADEDVLYGCSLDGTVTYFTIGSSNKLMLDLITRLGTVETIITNNGGGTGSGGTSGGGTSGGTGGTGYIYNGTPRFGLIPLNASSASNAVNGEIITDPSSGHIYTKNASGVVSKTVELENRINELVEIAKSSSVSYNFNADSYSHLMNDKSLIVVNIDRTIYPAKMSVNPDTGVNMYYISMEKMIFNMVNNTTYYIVINHTSTWSDTNLISFKYSGSYFKATKVFTNIGTSTDHITVYKITLNTSDIYKEVYPVMYFNSQIKIKDIMIYKIPTMISNNVLTELVDNMDTAALGSSTVYANGTYTLSSANPVEIMMSSAGLLPKPGLYAFSFYVSGNLSYVLTITTTVNGSVYETKQVNLSKLAQMGSGKTASITLKIPEVTNTNNWVKITSPVGTSGILIKNTKFELITDAVTDSSLL